MHSNLLPLTSSSMIHIPFTKTLYSTLYSHIFNHVLGTSKPIKILYFLTCYHKIEGCLHEEETGKKLNSNKTGSLNMNV